MRINEKILKSGERIALQLRELYGAFGYAQYKMSKFEEYDLYARNKDFLVSDTVITFTDTNGKLMALKPDVTLSIVKNSKNTAETRKVYYDENVYRISGGSRAYREIRQVGLECMGEIDDYAIAEVLQLAAMSLARICEDYVLDVSHLDIVSAVIDRLGVDAATRSALLIAVGEKNLHGIRELCPQADALCRLVSLQGEPARVLPELEQLLTDEASRKALSRLARIVAAVQEQGYTDRIRIDFSVVDDMNYYNGIVFKGFVNGVPQSVLSGGQYDRLMQKMDKKAGAIGFAVYLDLLERLWERSSDADVESVLLYDEAVEPAAVARAVRELQANREGSVLALRVLPQGLCYRRLWRVTKNGVEEVREDNA